MNGTYSVFAHFDDCGQADNACSQVMNSTNGIERIGTRRLDASRIDHGRIDSVLHGAFDSAGLADAVSRQAAPGAGLMLDPFLSSDTTAAVGASVADYDRNTGYVSAEQSSAAENSDDYIICAQGGREATEHAARLLRSLGGRNVHVCCPPGDFLEAQEEN